MRLARRRFAPAFRTAASKSKAIKPATTGSVQGRLPWPGLAAVAYRGFLVAFWTALGLFFALVIYNTIVGTSYTESETPQYSYPSPP
jgi:hypothetical protein